MARTKTVFVCRSCGATQSRWMGKCPDCGTWDALEAERLDAGAARDPQKGLVEAWAALADGVEPSAGRGALPIAEISSEDDAASRLSTGIGELDRVLGGVGGADGSRGLVPGSAVLIGGEPGIGKSTLLLQAAGALARSGSRVLYVSSEESAEQLGLRARRLGIEREAGLFVLADTNLARIVEQARRVAPAVIIIDSVQMIYKSDLDGAPGSVPQLRRCCAELVFLAKASGMAVVLVGHVTKDGVLAGPRLVEHLVDAVLYFEGDRHHAHRIVRAVKNRFGATHEVGLFEMSGAGLRELPEGLSAPVLVGEGTRRAGSVVCPTLTGTRCVLVEIQALTATGFLGAAKRKSSGVDPNRLAMLIAVLEQHAGLRLADRDVFASAASGLRVVEPASDLALLLAVAGAHFKRGLDPATAAVGEVGLGGEVRPVSQLDQRIREAARLGYRRIIVPAQAGVVDAQGAGGERGGRIEVSPVKSVSQAIEELG